MTAYNGIEALRYRLADIRDRMKEIETRMKAARATLNLRPLTMRRNTDDEDTQPVPVQAHPTTSKIAADVALRTWQAHRSDADAS